MPGTMRKLGLYLGLVEDDEDGARRYDDGSHGYGADDYDDLSIVFGGKSGSAYWAASKTHGDVPAGTEAWGDDHGTMIIKAGSCTRTQTVLAHVRSTDQLEISDEHEYGQSGDLMEPDPEVHHTMGDCTPLCPSVWVRTIGFQPSNSEANAWGQPKVVVALKRTGSQIMYSKSDD